MATATARNIDGIKFTEFPVQNERTLFAAKFKADHPTTERILEAHGLEKVTYQIAIPAIAENNELMSFFKGNWAWLAGKGMSQEMGGLHNFDVKTGELAEHTDRNIERSVHVWAGDQPLSLSVVTDDGVARVYGRRFNFDADIVPSLVASVVVGMQTAARAAAPLAVVSANAEDNGITITGITPQELKTLQRNAEKEMSAVTKAFGAESMPNTRVLIEALRIKT